MTKSKQILTASSSLTPPIPAAAAAGCLLIPPVGATVSADDGGVGKTHFLLQLMTAFRLAGLPVDVFQLDTKKTLEQKSGQPVTSLIVPDRRTSNADETSATDIIVPWYRALTSMPSTQRSVLFEIGGSLPPLVHSGMVDLDVEEDSQLLGLEMITAVVTKAGGDAAAQAIREIKRWERNVPSACRIVVLNEVAGCPIAAAEYLEPATRKAFLDIVERHPIVRMPKLHPRSMALYERLPQLPSEIVGWHRDNYVEAIERTGRPRDEAKRFVRDVAAWTGAVQEDLVRILPFLGEDRSNG